MKVKRTKHIGFHAREIMFSLDMHLYLCLVLQYIHICIQIETLLEIPERSYEIIALIRD